MQKLVTCIFFTFSRKYFLPFPVLFAIIEEITSDEDQYWLKYIKIETTKTDARKSIDLVKHFGAS